MNAEQRRDYIVVNNVIIITQRKNLVGQRGMRLQLRLSVDAILPSGWFELHSLGDAGFDGGHDHHMLERIGGPPIGSFHLWHDDDDYAHVEVLPELDPGTGEPAWKERYRDIPSAVAGIAGLIDRQLQAWRLPLLEIWDTH